MVSFRICTPRWPLTLTLTLTLVVSFRICTPRWRASGLTRVTDMIVPKARIVFGSMVPCLVVGVSPCCCLNSLTSLEATVKRE